jgi:Fe-S cluster assembly ATP-binding protein
MSLNIQNLHANIGEREILKGLNLEIPKGQIHAIMGKNGSGKSTLAKVMAGHPDYDVTGGEVTLDGLNLFEMAEPDERARAGLFVAFQYPMEIPGVTIANFIRAAVQARLPKGPRNFTSRAVNEGFSGGEKKRCEILQMAMLNPVYCILDETDSGLDIDALKIVSEGVNAMRSLERGMLVITHYQRLLDYIVPDVVHVMVDGQIVLSGDKSLALKLEANGYDWVEKEVLQQA